MFSKIPLLQFGDYKIDQIQRNIVLLLNKITDNPFLDGVLLKDVAISTSTTSIEHKLGRQYAGYLITKLNANSVVYIGDTTEQELYIKLRASAACTVDVWVF